MLDVRRTDRITGSRIGAVLGLNPYQSRNQVLKEMVLEHFGIKKEKNNFDVQRGITFEPIIINELEKNSMKVEQTGFLIHPKYNFLGATPDGVINDVLLDERLALEIKAPRKFYEDIPIYYFAQMQLEMEVLEVEQGLFIQGIKGDKGIEIQKENIHKTNFIEANLPSLEIFMEEYQRSIESQQDFILEGLATEWKQLSEMIDKYTSKKDELKKQILEYVGNKPIQTQHLSIIEKTRKGGIDYKKYCNDMNLTIPNDYLRSDTTYFELKAM